MELKTIIKKGYKQTEIGVIPEDWEVKKLELVINKFINGGTPSTQNENYWTGNIPWITGADILNQKVSIVRRYITKNAVKNSSTNIIKKDNLLLVTRTGVGKLAITPFDISISQDFTGIYPNKNYLSTNFAFYYFDFNKLILQNQNQGTSIKGITRETLKNLLIPIPPLSEQKAIAEVLGDMDALLAALGQKIAKKRLIKKGAMQELLTGKRRLKGFEKQKGMKQTEIGLIPEDWEVIDLGDKFSIKNGLNKEKKFFGYGTPIINYMDVFTNVGLYKKDIEGKVFLTHQEKENYKVKAGDLLFTRTSEIPEEIGMASVVLETIPDVVFSGFVLRARPKDNTFDNEFKKYCFRSNQVRKQIISTCSYTTRALTNGKSLSAIKIPVPSLIKEQTHIATILSDMDAEITGLEAQLKKYQQLKQALMQDLLTGRVRL